MRAGTEGGGCFPTGRHYPGLADRIARSIGRVDGLIEEIDPGADWHRLPIAIIDFETTGVDFEADRVVEIGIVHIDEGAVSGGFGILVNPGIPIPDESRAIHKISDADVADAPRFAEVLPRVLELLEGRIPVAYNAQFDRSFLLAEYGRNQASLPADAAQPPSVRDAVAWVDPLVWAREILGNEIKSRKLGDVCAHLEISLEGAHRAEHDAKATGEVLLALSDRMPARYSELVRIQGTYAAHQDVEFAGYRRR